MTRILTPSLLISVASLSILARVLVQIYKKLCTLNRRSARKMTYGDEPDHFQCLVDRSDANGHLSVMYLNNNPIQKLL